MINNHCLLVQVIPDLCTLHQCKVTMYLNPWVFVWLQREFCWSPSILPLSSKLSVVVDRRKTGAEINQYWLREDCTFSNPPFLLLPLSSLYSLLNDIFERGLGPSLLLPPSPSFSPLLEGDFITQIYGKFVTMQDTHIIQLATIHPPWGGDCWYKNTSIYTMMTSPRTSPRTLSMTSSMTSHDTSHAYM